MNRDSFTLAEVMEMESASDVVELHIPPRDDRADLMADLRETHLRTLAYACQLEGIDRRLQIERAGRDLANQHGDGQEAARRSEQIEALTELRRRIVSTSALEWPALPGRK